MSIQFLNHMMMMMLIPSPCFLIRFRIASCMLISECLCINCTKVNVPGSLHCRSSLSWVSIQITVATSIRRGHFCCFLSVGGPSLFSSCSNFTLAFFFFFVLIHSLYRWAEQFFFSCYFSHSFLSLLFLLVFLVFIWLFKSFATRIYLFISSRFFSLLLVVFVLLACGGRCPFSIFSFSFFFRTFSGSLFFKASWC